MSSRFLAAKCARMLVLAGQERLDKELMVGQMYVPVSMIGGTANFEGRGNSSSKSFQTLVTIYTK